MTLDTGGRRLPVTLRGTARIARRSGRGHRVVRLASRRLTFAGGHARRVSIPLTKQGKALLRGRRSLRVKVVASAAGKRARRTIVLK